MLGQEDAIHPSPEAIRAGLERVTASSGFAAAERMRRFLTFVVQKTLAGESEALKEYPVGVEVFDRGPDFDPRTDTIVRVEARRLRRKLQEYYEKEGLLDSVVIGLPPGSYVPIFELRRPADAPSPATAGARWRVVLWAAAGLAILALGLGILKPLRNRNAPAASMGSVAVLPFLDMSPAKDQEYFCDGMSEELINALSAVPGLKVTARTSAFRYKGKAEDVRRMGADLGVEHIVEGSVRKSGQNIRVTAQLIRVSDGSHLWSRQFDRKLIDAFVIQEELARAVASSIGVELGVGSSLARTTSVEAYQNYLEGRHYWRQFIPGSTAYAVTRFQRAIAADPSFAPAYAGLADSYMQMNVWRMGPPSQLAEQARQAAAHAIRLDARSAEAESQLGAVSGFYDWDWKGCEQHFRRAIAARPNYVNAHWLFATTCLGPNGRLQEALDEARRSAVLDPLSPLAQTMVGAVPWYRREFDSALAAFDHALQLDPSFVLASMFKATVYLSQGRMDLVLPLEAQCGCRGFVQAKLGNTAYARAEIERLLVASVNPVAIAAAYAGLGEPEHALDWLEKAADSKIPQMIWIDFQAPFETLHETARYRAIRSRMHLR